MTADGEVQYRRHCRRRGHRRPHRCLLPAAPAAPGPGGRTTGGGPDPVRATRRVLAELRPPPVPRAGHACSAAWSPARDWRRSPSPAAPWPCRSGASWSPPAGPGPTRCGCRCPRRRGPHWPGPGSRSAAAYAPTCSSATPAPARQSADARYRQLSFEDDQTFADHLGRLHPRRRRDPAGRDQESIGRARGAVRRRRHGPVRRDLLPARNLPASQPARRRLPPGQRPCRQHQRLPAHLVPGHRRPPARRDTPRCTGSNTGRHGGPRARQVIVAAPAPAAREIVKDLPRDWPRARRHQVRPLRRRRAADRRTIGHALGRHLRHGHTRPDIQHVLQHRQHPARPGTPPPWRSPDGLRRQRPRPPPGRAHRRPGEDVFLRGPGRDLPRSCPAW